MFAYLAAEAGSASLAGTEAAALANGDAAPDVCPECGASRESFVYFAYPDASAWEEEDRFIGLGIPDLSEYVIEQGEF